MSVYNSKLTSKDSALIFNCLIGILMRSIRLAQTKLCLSTVVRLQGAIKTLISSMIELKWIKAEGANVDNLPYPTVTMVKFCLEKKNYRKEPAEVLLNELLKAQKRIADKLERTQHLSTAHATEAARLMFHVENFEESKIDMTRDGEKLISLGRRGCCLNGRSLFFPTITDNHSSARGMSMKAMTHVVHHTSQSLADMLSSERAYYKYGKPFDPRFLVFEYVVNFMLRDSQAILVNTFVDAARQGKSLVNQMIMGAGKTTVIAPLLSLILADGRPLVMVVIPKALLDMGLSVMRNVFSNIISKKVYTFEFSRSMVDANQKPLDLPALLSTLTKATRDQSIVCTTPESVKALMLKYIDLMEETRKASPSLSLPRKNFGTHYLWDKVAKEAAIYKEKCEQMDILADILCLWRDKGIALLDEVDTLLHPLRSELNFPVGDKSVLDLVESGDRFIFPLFLYDAFFYARVGRSSVYKVSTDEETQILKELKLSIEEGIECLAFQNFPHPILLRKSYYRQKMMKPLSRWAMIWLKTQDDVSGDLTLIKRHSQEKLQQATEMMVTYMTTLRATDATVFVEKNFTVASIKRLNLARDWIVSFIPHTISKINCVDYGLLQENHLKVWEDEGEPRETQSKARLLMAVPFVGKDVPSRHSEFAHPEVLIGLTILSYRYQGLRHSDMKKVVTRLKESMQQEPGAFFQRPSQIKFKDWNDLYVQLENKEGRQPLIILPLHLFPPDLGDQMQVLINAFSKLPEVVEFWLTTIAFPDTLRYQVRKLQASGVDLGSSILLKIRLGFSGTPSNLLPIDMGDCKYEEGCQSSIIEVCQSSRFTTFTKFDKKWDVEKLLTYVATHPSLTFHALIDTGALVTGMSNKEVAEFMLKVGLKGMECCVYLDDADRKMVINRAGLVIPFARSGVAPERRFSFFDQVHTTGMDIKQGIDACAAVTLGKDMTFRDHSQGIYRMRGLGKGQTCHLLVVPEVLELIYQSVPPSKHDDQFLLENVVTWLVYNSLRSSNQQYMALCQQNLTNLYRKEAFRGLCTSRNPPHDKEFVFQNRFVYTPKEMSEEEAAAVLENHPIMDKDAFERLKQRYDIDVTLLMELEGGQPTDIRSGEYTVPILDENQDVVKFLNDLLEMAAKDIVKADDLANSMRQKKIPPKIFDHQGGEIDWATVGVKLKDNKFVRHPKFAVLEPVKNDDEKKADNKVNKDSKPVEILFREYPHVNIKIGCDADVYAKFTKHYQPKTKSELASDSVGKEGDKKKKLEDMTPEERLASHREEQLNLIASLDGFVNLDNEAQDENPYGEKKPMTRDRSQWLNLCLDLFCENLELDIQTFVTKPKKFSQILEDIAQSREHFVNTDAVATLVEEIVQKVKDTESALVKKLEKAKKAAEEDGQNLDTELVQESEQEQEAIQQTASGGERIQQYSKPREQMSQWHISKLSSATTMINGNTFYPLANVDEVKPMGYPAYVLLSDNHSQAVRDDHLKRRLKNVCVLLHWKPKHDGADYEDNTEQLIALLEGDFPDNPGQFLRLLLDDGITVDAKKRDPNEKVEPWAQQKSYVVAVSLEEAETLRRIIHNFMGPVAPSLGDRPLLHGTSLALTTVNGLWLTDLLEPDPEPHRMLLEAATAPTKMEMGRHCLRFFNCSLDLTKDDVIVLIHALQQEDKENRKTSYASVVEGRRRVRKNCTGTHVEHAFEHNHWNTLAEIRDFSIQVLTAMRRENKTFADIDTDGSGEISAEEFTTALFALEGLNPTADKVKQLLAYVDDDNNGVLNSREFCAIFLGVEQSEFNSTPDNPRLASIQKQAEDQVSQQLEEKSKGAEEAKVVGPKKKGRRARRAGEGTVGVSDTVERSFASVHVEDGPKAAHDVWEYCDQVGAMYLRSGGHAAIGYDDIVTADESAKYLTFALRGVQLVASSWYFEVRVVKAGFACIGVIDDDFVADSDICVGIGPMSWGYNGESHNLMEKGQKTDTKLLKWKSGDILCCKITFVSHGTATIEFALNDKWATTAKMTVKYDRYLCPAISCDSTFSGTWNIGRTPMVNRPLLNDEPIMTVFDWVKIKLETIFAIQSGSFFREDPVWEEFLNTSQPYVYTGKELQFQGGAMLQGRWYMEFTIQKISDGSTGLKEFEYLYHGYPWKLPHNAAELDRNKLAWQYTTKRHMLNKDQTIKTEVVVKDVLGIGYDCEEHCVWYSVNGRWARKYGFNPGSDLFVLKPTWVWHYANFTGQVNLGRDPFRFKPAGFKGVLDWMDRLDVFKDLQQKANEAAQEEGDDDKVEEDMDEYEALELQIEESKDREKFLTNNKAGSRGGGGEVRMDCLTGYNSVKITQFHAEEAKCKLEVYGESAYPSFVGNNLVTLSFGKWYFEVALKNVNQSNFRASIGWVSPDFTPDALAGKGVGDQPGSWGIQLKSVAPKVDHKLYKVNETEKTKDELIKEEKEKIQKEKEAEELKELANGKFHDDDDEQVVVSAVEEKAVTAVVEERDVDDITRSTLLPFSEGIKTGDIIGCAIDFENNLMSYSLNGEWKPEWRIKFSKKGEVQTGGLRPAVSLSNTFPNVNLLFGNLDNPEKQFSYPPPEYHFALNLCFDSRVLSHFQKANHTQIQKSAKSPQEFEQQKFEFLAKAAEVKKSTTEQEGTESVASVTTTDHAQFTDYVSKACESGDGKDLVIWDRPRRYRKKWMDFIVDINNITQKRDWKAGSVVPHLSVFGKLYTEIPAFIRQLDVYISSAMCDTTLETDLLDADVHPYLRDLAKYANFQYSATQMSNDDNDPRVFDAGLRSIETSAVVSRGVSFVTLLGNKYGCRSLPSLIPQDEMKVIEATVSKPVMDIFTKWYEMDTNFKPPQFVFRVPVGKSLKDWGGSSKKGMFSKEKDGDCATVHAGLGEFVKKLEGLNSKRAVLYKGCLESEVQNGVIGIEKRNQLLQSFAFARNFKNAPTKETPLLSKYFDVGSTKVTEELREKVMQRFYSMHLEHRYKEYQVDWDEKTGLNPLKHKMYLRKFSNYYCDLVAESLVVAAKRVAKLSSDPLMEEVAFHNNFAVSQSQDFIGRETELQKIANYVRVSSRQPLIVYGSSGSGKTALLAQAAAACSKKQEHFMMIRFCGKSTSSATAAELMRSICLHLGSIYGQSNANVPFNYNSIKTVFKDRLALPSAYCPLVIFVDSLDQLSDEDQGRQLKWLPKKLPKNVRLILSVYSEEKADVSKPEMAPFRVLQNRFPLSDLNSDNVWVKVEPVDVKESEKVINEWLQRKQRTLTVQQRQVLVNAFQSNSSARLPLYLKVVFDLCCTWKSSDVVKEIPTDAKNIVEFAFKRLEAKHGKITAAALSYITCAKFGLSRNEIEDLLSLDDDVLEGYFGKEAPAVRRIPSFAWVALKEDLAGFIVETRAQGITVYSWLHRQFQEVVWDTYYKSEEQRKQKFRLVAEYFSGKYAKGKQVNGKGPLIDRKVNSQELYELIGDKYRFNERRLAELPHLLMHSANWDELVNTLSSFEFITAKCVVSSVSQLISDFKDSIESITKLKTVDRKFIGTLIEYKDFLVQNTTFIGLDPTVVFNLARNMPDETSPCKGAIAWYDQLDRKRRRAWIKQVYKPQTVYPGIRQTKLEGYMTAIVFSPDGRQFATLMGDNQITLKIYEVEDFEELAEYKFNRPGAVVSFEGNVIPDDGIKEMQMYEEIDWFGNYICLILDNVSKVNITNGSVVLTCDSVDAKLSKCRFSNDGTKIICMGDGECVLFDANTGALLNKYDAVQFAALSPSGGSLAVVERPKPVPGEVCRAHWGKSASAVYDCYVKADNGDGTFYIQFLDGDFDRNCPAKDVHISRDQNRLLLLDANKKREVKEVKKAEDDKVPEVVGNFVPPAPIMVGGKGRGKKVGGWIPMEMMMMQIVIHDGGNSNRFGRLPGGSADVDKNDFEKPKEGETADVSVEYLSMCNSVEFSKSGNYLCALMPPSQAVIFSVNEDEKTPTLVQVIQYTIPCKPIICRFTEDSRHLFVVTTSTFHVVDALTGVYQGHLTQDFIRSVSNAKLSKDCSRVLSVGHRTLKLWDMNRGWDKTKPPVIESTEKPEEKEEIDDGTKTEAQKKLEEAKKKRNTQYTKIQTSRTVGNPLELDVDAQFSKDGRQIVFLSIDLSKGNPVSVVKWLPVEDLEKVPNSDKLIPVTTTRLRLPVPEENAKDVVKTERGLEKSNTTEKTETQTKNTATTSTLITKVIITKENQLTIVDRAPSSLAISPNETQDSCVVSGVANLGIPRPKTDVMIQLELRKNATGNVQTSLSHDSGKNDPLKVTFSPDGSFLVAIFHLSSSISFWRMDNTDKPLKTIKGNSKFADFTFLKDDKYIMCVAETDISLCNLTSAQEEAKQSMTGGRCSCVAVSTQPHNLVAVGTEAGEVLIYHLVLKDGYKFKLKIRFQAYGSEHEMQRIFACSFIRDTGILVTIADNVLKVWQPFPEKGQAFEITRYYSRCMLVKMSVHRKGQIVVFGNGGIEPLIVTVENLESFKVPVPVLGEDEEEVKITAPPLSDTTTK